MRRFSIKSAYLLLAALIVALPTSLALARGGGGGHGGGHGGGGHAHAHGGARVAHHRFASRPVRSASRAFASHSVSSTFHADHGHGFARNLGPGWNRGHWHHGRHAGHLGWWWGVGGIWYYYPDDYRDEYPYEADDPPRYVSEIVVPQASFAAEPDTSIRVYVERDHAIYYAPGDSAGVSYHTGTQCAEAQRKAGGAGICMVK